ncbi:hypothetical protein M3Y97_00184300 [Aphelenchoides bicaudatus]|nr:hypothetical protein M3Y97_00184300 [Aphelenchoides bicaudatus]
MITCFYSDVLSMQTEYATLSEFTQLSVKTANTISESDFSTASEITEISDLKPNVYQSEMNGSPMSTDRRTLNFSEFSEVSEESEDTHEMLDAVEDAVESDLDTSLKMTMNKVLNSLDNAKREYAQLSEDSNALVAQDFYTQSYYNFAGLFKEVFCCVTPRAIPSNT